jgi:hypothetical protein
VRKSTLLIVPATVLAVVALPLSVWAAALTTPMSPGDTLTVTCSTQLTGTVKGTRANLTCATPASSATPVPPTATPVPPTATPVPAAAAPVPPTPTPGGAQPVAGQPCPQWVHDGFVTTGPNGKQYPTWHPAVDPASGCLFGHEHGSDPRTSKANAAMPAFGYVNDVAGQAEPHAGFKVFVFHAGQIDSDNKPMPADARMVFHQGTAGVARYTTQFHSLEYDYVARDGSGREFHVQGLADTGPASKDGSTCDNPRRGGKDFSTLGCPDPYEIWNDVHLEIVGPGDIPGDAFHVRLRASGSIAAFNPITTRDPADNSRLVYTLQVKEPNSPIDPLSPASEYQGCAREAYVGPNYFRNAGNPTTYYTDVFGRIQPGPGPTTVEQRISAVSSTINTIFKTPSNFCGNGIHAPN